MARKLKNRSESVEPVERRGTAGPGGTPLKVAMLAGAIAVLGISYANQRQVAALEESFSARLNQLESRLASAAAPSAPSPPPGQLDPFPLPLSARTSNPTLSALVGVKPVGSKMPDENRTYSFDLSNSPARGPAEAPISIVEFSNFQCSFCRKAQPTLTRITEVYGDQVRWIWKHLPLSIHKDAPMAHLASVAADRQGRFWEFKDKLFANPGRIKPDDLRLYAQELGLRMQRFEEDLADPKTQRAVEIDMEEAVEIDLTATPGFFVNGRYMRGAKPFEDFAAVINEELSRLGLPIPAAAQVEEQAAPGR